MTAITRHLSRIVACLCLLFASMPATAGAPAAPEWRVDRRVELASVVCRLAGFNEFQPLRVPDYDAAVMRHFGPFKDHPSVLALKTLREQRGIGYNAPVEAAVLADRQSWTPRVALRPWPAYLDSRWDEASLRGFLKALATFARDTKADAFFETQQTVYAELERVHQARFPGEPDLAWYASHFPLPPGTTFRLVPGPLTGMNSYSMHFRLPGGALEIVSVIALPGRQPNQPLVIPEQALQLIVHEFCHAFANPWVDAHAQQLDAPAASLFAVSAESLKAQAYKTPRVMLYESLVRAATIRYLADHGKQKLVEWSLADDRQKGFWWTDDLAELLKSKDGESAAVLTARTGAIIDFFKTWAASASERVAQKQAAVKTEREARLKQGPQLVSLTPADGDMAVDPVGTVLELTFDRPMNGQVSLYGEVPRVTGKPAWNTERTVLTIPVAFTPGTKYVLRINSDEDEGGFRSAAGERLTPRTWTFAVR